MTQNKCHRFAITAAQQDLTHLGRDKIAAISQTAFSNVGTFFFKISLGRLFMPVLFLIRALIRAVRTLKSWNISLLCSSVSPALSTKDAYGLKIIIVVAEEGRDPLRFIVFISSTSLDARKGTKYDNVQKEAW